MINRQRVSLKEKFIYRQTNTDGQTDKECESTVRRKYLKIKLDFDRQEQVYLIEKL